MAFTRNFLLWFFAAVCTNTVTSFTNSNVFDQELYESVLDEEQCERQLMFLLNNSLGLQCKYSDTISMFCSRVGKKNKLKECVKHYHK